MNLLKVFSQWNAARQSRAIQDNFESGYDYTCGLVLRKNRTAADVQDIYSTKGPQDAEEKAFDRGMEAGLNKLISLKVLDDNRI